MFWARHLEVLDQDGQRALRHGAVTDEQDFVFEFQHGRTFLARHFVRKIFFLQAFIEKIGGDGPFPSYHPSTYAKISGATMVASDSMMNLGVSTPSLPQVIFSFGTAPE